MKQNQRWTAEKARDWYAKQPWPVGCNYVTSNAVNDVEMWMKDTFDLPLIRKELADAGRLGFNTVRVFLSYLVWRNEGAVFERNFDDFLGAAAENGISVLPVLFDDCAFDSGADPVYGRQPEPIPGVHNGRWVPSPGFAVQDDPALFGECRGYVDALVGGHRNDSRILAWDLYNEPGNTGRGAKSLPLLTNAFAWAREWEPIQPLTVGIWSFADSLTEVNKACAELSDVISIHSYTGLAGTKDRLAMAEASGRPVFVTEWFHRPAGNGYRDHLPLFYEKKIGVWQWGMIAGKTQTWLSWDRNANAAALEGKPFVWQHDLIRQDGTPFDPEEIELLKKYTSLRKEKEES